MVTQWPSTDRTGLPGVRDCPDPWVFASLPSFEACDDALNDWVAIESLVYKMPYTLLFLEIVIFISEYVCVIIKRLG